MTIILSRNGKTPLYKGNFVSLFEKIFAKQFYLLATKLSLGPPG